MAVLLLALAAHAAVPPAPAPPVASCELLELVISFAGQLLASDFHRGRGAMAAVGDALELGAQGCRRAAPEEAAAPAAASRAGARIAAARQFWVAANGSDAASGTLLAPWATLARAQAAVRQAAGPCTVWLRGGRYQLSAPLRLGPADSHTTWAAWRAETVVLSGGQLLAPGWHAAGAPHPEGVLVAQLPPGTAPFTTLFHGGRRQIRARFPNINDPVSDLYPAGYARCAAGKGVDPWGGTGWAAVADEGLTLHVDEPNRSGTHFPTFQQLLGGPAALWSPARCYDDAGQDYSLKQHDGLFFNTSTFGNRTAAWTDVQDTEVHSMHPEFWSNYGWRLANATAESLHFGEGGWQDQAGPTLGRQNLW